MKMIVPNYSWQKEAGRDNRKMKITSSFRPELQQSSHLLFGTGLFAGV